MLRPGSDATAADSAVAVVRPGGNGAFTLSGVAPGDYTMMVRVFFDEAETMRLVSSGTLEGDPAFSMPLSVSGTPIEDLRIVVPASCRRCAGRVVFEGGTPKGDVLGSVFASNTHGDMTGRAGVRWVPTAASRCRLRPGAWRFSAWAPRGWMIKRLHVPGNGGRGGRAGGGHQRT